MVRKGRASIYFTWIMGSFAALIAFAVFAGPISINTLRSIVHAQSSGKVSLEVENGVASSTVSKQSETPEALQASGGSYITFNDPNITADSFFEDFTGDTTINSLDYGVWYRDPYLVGTSEWMGDHSDMGNGDCGAPTTTRLVHRGQTNEQIYLCQSVGGDPAKAHLMDAVGDTSGYTIAYFSPKKVFNHVDSVKFKVNLTNLGDRKWWKVGVVSNSKYMTTIPQGGSLCCNSAPGFLFADAGASGLPDVGNGLVGPDRLLGTYGEDYPGFFGIGSVHNSVNVFPSPDDKATRWPVSLVDNKNGTITFTVAGVSNTQAGAMPPCPCRVVFYDHNYTPDKSFYPRVPNPYTWHWDDIQVN